MTSYDDTPLGNALAKKRLVKECGSVLNEALTVINGERQDHYGNPEDSFTLIASYWNPYLIARQKQILTEHGRDAANYKLVDLLTSRDVAIMMTLFKLARESHQHKRDNIIDAAGYLGILGDLK